MKKISLLFVSAIAGLLLTSCGSEEEKHEPPVLSGIEVTTLPTKTAYYLNEEFDPAGMVVTATYSDASTKEIASSDYSVRGFNSSEVNPALELTVTYLDKFTKFTVSVSARTNTYTISYHVYVDGVLNPAALDTANSSLPTNIASGTTVNIHVAPNSGYTYIQFYPDSFDYGSDFFNQLEFYTFEEDTFSFVMVSYNVGFNFYFTAGEVKPSHEISYTSYLLKDEGEPEDKGSLLFSVSSSLPETGQEEANVSVKFVPTSEYTFDHFSVPEEYPAAFKSQFTTTSSQFTFEMSTFNVHFDVYFRKVEKTTYSVSFETVDNMNRFRVNYGYPSEYAAGDPVVFLAEPADGYELDGLPFDTNDSSLVISKSLVGNTSYTFEMPSHDVHLSVNVVKSSEQTTYQIRYTAYVNNVLTPGAIDRSQSSLPDNVAEGASVNIHVVAASGYTYDGFSPDSYSYGSDFFSQFELYEGTEDTLSFTMVGYTVGFNLYFQEVITETHDVTFASVDHLTFNPSGSTTGVLVGSTFSFTVSVESGYVLDGAPYVSGDASVSISKSGDIYSLTMPNKDITITASTKVDEGGEDVFGGEYSTTVAMSTPGYYFKYSLIFNSDGSGSYVRNRYTPDLVPTDTKTLTFSWSSSGSSLTLTLESGDNTDFTNSYRLFPRNKDKTDPKDVVTNTTGVIVDNSTVTMSLYNFSTGAVANTLSFVRA